ncbi:MAG: hypothetical protein RRY12_01250 [Cloacibacillus sp.]
MSNYKTAYSYNAENGEYLGEAKAWESPLEPGVYHLPAGATYTTPPAHGEHEAARWNTITGAWELVPDYRGEIYWNKSTREKVEIKELGITPAPELTDIEPTDHEAEWNGTTWEIPLAVCRKRKLNEVKTAFNAYVAGSITTTQGYKMQFGESDSLKLEGSIKLMEAQGIAVAYLTDAGDDTHYDIPLATIKAVQLEMLAAYGAAHARKQQLRAQVEAAADKATLDTIVITWEAE